MVDTRLPLWRACKKAGLRQIGWHALRHTFASHLVMRAASIKDVQELLGHSSIQMTMRYAHLAPEVASETVLRAGSALSGRNGNPTAYAES